MNSRKSRPQRSLTVGVMFTGLIASAPLWAVSMAATGPAHPLPASGAVPAPAPATPPVTEALTAGSTALIPLVAADVPDTPISTLEASAPTSSAAKGRRIDDIDFIARATDNSRREAQNARDALPQLKHPDLRRIAEEIATDRGEANARLSKLANARMWPTPPPPQVRTPPAGTASPDFDATWTAGMIAAHERAVALYRAQALAGEDQPGTDQDLRQYARETLATLQHHLDELRRLQK